MNSHRILVVDDDGQVRKLLKLRLESENYTVLEASNGNEALSRFRENPTPLILCDIFMEDGDGIELIQEIRRGFPNVKIVAMSGGGLGARREMLEAARLLGAVESITKPIDFEALFNILDRLLQVGR